MNPNLISSTKKLVLGFSLAVASLPALSQVNLVRSNDTSAVVQITRLLRSGSLNLNFPKSTAAFYRARNFAPAWSPQRSNDAVWDALFFAECAIQYGLNRQSYHVDKLSCGQLSKISTSGTFAQQAEFDLLLTDAMLSFINHLHFGRLNPAFPAATLDAQSNGFALRTLVEALAGDHFTETIEAVQPRFDEYRLLQDYLRLVVGQYVGDSYETPERVVRQIAANLERWRWEPDPGATYVSVNIPAYTLTVNNKGYKESFKVIVGDKHTPTPIVYSRITHFTVAPDWNVPAKIFRNEVLPKAIRRPAYLADNHYYLFDREGKEEKPTIQNLQRIRRGELLVQARQSNGCDNALGKLVFRFPNSYAIYLHDTPYKLFFDSELRDLSHGCIRLEHPEQLARLLIQHDGGAAILAFERAWMSGKRQNFVLSRPVTIVTRYFTCRVDHGLLTTWQDVYDRDRPVADALLGSESIRKQLADYQQQLELKTGNGARKPFNSDQP